MDIMKKLFKCVLLVFISFSLNSVANENLKDVLSATGKLLKNSDNESIVGILTDCSKHIESSVLKNKVLEVTALAIKAQGGDITEFKSANPQTDFSKVEAATDAKTALKKKLPLLILFLASEYEVQMGNAPSHLEVKVNGHFAPSANNILSENTTAPIGNAPSEDVAEAVPTKPMAPADIDKESIFYKAYHAAKKVQSGDVEGTKELLKLSVQDNGEEINQMLVKNIALAMINSGGKSLKGYFAKVKKTFGGDEYLTFLDQEPYQTRCKKCKGKGFNGVDCLRCDGGKCGNCKGKKQIVYKGLDRAEIKKACPSCKASGNCRTCEGEGIKKLDCSTCKAKGTLFLKSVVPEEYAKSLQRIIDFMPKLADDQGIYIGVGINRLALARIEKEKRQKEEAIRLKAEMERRKKEERLARLEAERKAAAAAKKAENEKGMIVRVIELEPVEEDGTNEQLSHALLEMRENLNTKERLGRTNLYETVDARYKSGLATLFLEVSTELANRDSDTRHQIIDGFYRFWKLRCDANGAGEADLKVTHKGEVIAERENDMTVLRTQ